MFRRSNGMLLIKSIDFIDFKLTRENNLRVYVRNCERFDACRHPPWCFRVCRLTGQILWERFRNCSGCLEHALDSDGKVVWNWKRSKDSRVIILVDKWKVSKKASERLTDPYEIDLPSQILEQSCRVWCSGKFFLFITLWIALRVR